MHRPSILGSPVRDDTENKEQRESPAKDLSKTLEPPSNRPTTGGWLGGLTMTAYGLQPPRYTITHISFYEI